MGLSSSQARLLNLTARMHQIEYGASRMEAMKLQMANESRRVYEDYLEALDKTKIQIKTLTTNGAVTFVDLTSYEQFLEAGFALVVHGLPEDFAFAGGGSTPRITSARPNSNSGSAGNSSVFAGGGLIGYSPVFSGDNATNTGYMGDLAQNDGTTVVPSGDDTTNPTADPNDKTTIIPTVITPTYSGDIVNNTSTLSGDINPFNGGSITPAGDGTGSTTPTGDDSTNVFPGTVSPTFSGDTVGTPTFSGDKVNDPTALSGGINPFNGGSITPAGDGTGSTTPTGDDTTGTTPTGVGNTTVIPSTVSPTFNGDMVGTPTFSGDKVVNDPTALGGDTNPYNNGGSITPTGDGTGTTNPTGDDTTGTTPTGVGNSTVFPGTVSPTQKGDFAGNVVYSGDIIPTNGGTTRPTGGGSLILPDGPTAWPSITPDFPDIPGSIINPDDPPASGPDTPDMPDTPTSTPRGTSSGSSVICRSADELIEAIKALFKDENGNPLDISSALTSNFETLLTNLINSGSITIIEKPQGADDFPEIGTLEFADYETSVATNTKLQEAQDEVEMRKAEAKYEADMKRIDMKDRRYDSELAALDNERNAVKQEMETLKTVAKDNVDRTFRLFT